MNLCMYFYELLSFTWSGFYKNSIEILQYARYILLIIIKKSIYEKLENLLICLLDIYHQTSRDSLGPIEPFKGGLIRHTEPIDDL